MLSSQARTYHFLEPNLLFLRRGVAGTTKGMDVLLWGVGRQTIFGFKSGRWQSKKNEPVRLSILKP